MMYAKAMIYKFSLFLIFIIFPSLVLAEFKLYTDQQRPEFEAGTRHKKNDEGMVTVLLATGEGRTLNHAYCNAFEQLSDFIEGHSDNMDAEYLNFAGLQVHTEGIMDDKVLKIETTIIHGENFIICDVIFEDTSDSEFTEVSNLTMNDFGQKEDSPLDLRKDFEDGNCLYRSLENGYHVEDDLFYVEVGFKCKNGILRLN